ncbi:facilitated trehalose transporter Tret1 isoform X2 [Venturia canescens]|nr:facilitated trehalose transporter Tret1 isoform X2 [Venturia canescens]XP_043278858.1 facilitated trehalose transporter Tret1 isoform X2 [Venturia canescens]
MPEKNIGISQQTLVSNAGENGNRPRKLPQYIAGLASTLGALAAGMVLGWTSPAGDNGIELKKHKVYSFDFDDSEFSWVSSSFNLGAATICVPIGILCDYIGRKTSMLILTVPFTIGWACVIWPNSVATLIAGRYILGISGGAFCVTAPMYASEMADNETRGRLGSYFQLLLTSGILLTYILGSIETLSMFNLSLISASIPLIFCVVFFFMPETPTYYLIKDNVTMARKTLTWLRGSHYNVEIELQEQREALAEAKRNQSSFFSAIRSRAAIKGLIIAFGLMFFQQLSGVNAIIFYAGGIFAQATGSNASWPTIVVGAMQVIAVFVSTIIVDKLGRRLLLLISSVSMCITTLILGVYFYCDEFGPSMENVRWLPLLCICGFIILFSIGFGPIPWMMMGEIFSSQIKGVAGSSACLFNWLMAFVVTKFYGDVKSAIGPYGAFWIFSAICGLSVVFVFFLVPETKGKTLDQIQMELGGETPSVQSAGKIKT